MYFPVKPTTRAAVYLSLFSFCIVTLDSTHTHTHRLSAVRSAAKPMGKDNKKNILALPHVPS